MRLDDYKKCFSLTYDQFLAQHDVPANRISENLRYEKTENVNRVDLPDDEFFFFKNGQLKLIYISNEALAKTIWNDFKSSTNTLIPGKKVRSRGGKTSNQLIFRWTRYYSVDQER